LVGVDLVPVGDAIAVEIGSVEGFARSGNLIGVFEAEEALVSGATDFMADVLVFTPFDDVRPMPLIEMIHGIGNLEKIAPSDITIPDDDMLTSGVGNKFQILVYSVFLGWERCDPPKNQQHECEALH